MAGGEEDEFEETVMAALGSAKALYPFEGRILFLLGFASIRLISSFSSSSNQVKTKVP